MQTNISLSTLQGGLITVHVTRAEYKLRMLMSHYLAGWVRWLNRFAQAITHLTSLRDVAFKSKPEEERRREPLLCRNSNICHPQQARSFIFWTSVRWSAIQAAGCYLSVSNHSRIRRYLIIMRFITEGIFIQNSSIIPSYVVLLCSWKHFKTIEFLQLLCLM